MIKAYLYDANGEDHEEDVSSGKLPGLQEDQLLWLDLVGREEEKLKELGALLKLKSQTLHELRHPSHTLTLNNYGDYFHCSVLSLNIDEEKVRDIPILPKGIRLDLLVGKNWVATVAKQKLYFLEEFRERDRGETVIGILSAPALAASLLDWHLTSYHSGLEVLEIFVDKLDVRLLEGRSVSDDILVKVVEARTFLAGMRRNLSAQRSVFYGLARPDFALVASADATQPYLALERRFERMLDLMEHGRELVQGTFDLITTRLAESTNVLLRRLTFLSLILGCIGAVAGVFGMNFQTRYTESGEFGFWLVLGALALGGIISLAVSRYRKWI